MPSAGPVGPVGPEQAPTQREELSQFPAVTEPLMAPPTLEALLQELKSAQREGNFQALADCVRDALGFTTRYYAGLLVAACRQLSCLPATLVNSEGTHNVEESARQLLLCLDPLHRRTERLAKKLIQVFAEDCGGWRRFVDYLSPREAPEFSIVAFCRAPRNHRPTSDDLAQAIRWLDQWMSSSFGFFLDSEQRFEPGPFFGQVEQVVVFEQYTLPTGLTLRLKELRQPTPDSTALVLDTDRPPSGSLGIPVESSASGPAQQVAIPVPAPPSGQALNLGVPIAAPPDTPIALAAPVERPSNDVLNLGLPIQGPTGEVAAPDSPPEAVALDSEAVPAPSPATPPPPVESAMLVDFLQLKLNRNPVTTRPEAKPQAPQGYLDCDIDPAGLRKNEQGKFGYSGYLWIQLRGEGEVEIEGTVTCENSRVELSPSTFQGVQSRIVYWVDPDELRRPRGHVVIRAHNQVRQIPVWKLLPESFMAHFSVAQILALLFAPGILGSLYTSWVFWTASGRIERSLHDLLKGEFSHFINPTHPLSLRESGVGFLDLRLMPEIEATLLLFFCMAWMAPIGSAFVYLRLPVHEKRSYSLAYALALVFPSLYYMMLWPSKLLSGMIFRHPDFRFMDFRLHLTEFLVLNLVSAFLANLWTGGTFHRYFNPLGRSLGLLLGLTLFGVVTLILVYGRSWLGWI